MAGSIEINVFEVRKSSTTVCLIFDISSRACPSAFAV